MTYRESILEIVGTSNERDGSSVHCIRKKVQASMPLDKKWRDATFCGALRAMVTAGDLIVVQKKNCYYKLSEKMKKQKHRYRYWHQNFGKITPPLVIKKSPTTTQNSVVQKKNTKKSRKNDVIAVVGILDLPSEMFQNCFSYLRDDENYLFVAATCKLFWKEYRISCEGSANNNKDFKRTSFMEATISLSRARYSHRWLHMSLNKKVSYCAARNGNRAVLQWLRENRCPWDETTCAMAASYGHFDLLLWLLRSQCPCGTDTYIEAFLGGHWKILHWAHEESKHQPLLLADPTHVFRLASLSAARDGHLHVLRWAHARNYQLHRYLCISAAEGGHLDVLQWAHSQGFPFYKGTTAAAALHGHLSLLKWAHENGAVWNERTFKRAVIGGNLEVLKYMHEAGCPWDHWACAHAAEEGNLNVLKWLRDRDCPWKDTTCLMAAQAGRLEILQWSHQNGAEWSVDVCAVARQRNHMHIIDWIHQANLPYESIDDSL